VGFPVQCSSSKKAKIGACTGRSVVGKEVKSCLKSIVINHDAVNCVAVTPVFSVPCLWTFAYG